MLLQLSVNNQSVDSSGITNDYQEAINEYIWNSFEANAVNVFVDSLQNGLTGIDKIIIRDDGDGIKYSELKETFGAFLTSKKRLLSLKVKAKVNKGKGRFSFIAFAKNAVWNTIYKVENEFKQFSIKMSAATKDVVDCTEPESVNAKSTGTEVIFTNIDSLIYENLNFEIMEPVLLKEFAWFLYLYKDKNYKIIFNGVTLDYSKYVNVEFSETIIEIIDNHKFEISVIVWQKTINEKFCCYYFDANNVLKDRNTTTFNRNTINFNHSVYVKSDFFDNMEYVPNGDDPQMHLCVNEDGRKILKKLDKKIQSLIDKKMRIYLSGKADEIVDEMINVRKTFPAFSNDVYGQMRCNDLKRVTREIYKIQPMLFFKLKPVQEKSLLGFLNLLLNSEERENVLDIIEQIVELSPAQRHEFSNILKKTALENIIETIKFLEERFRVIEILRSIVYDLTLYTNERDHIQKLVENHFWLFGEQYNLASADQRMKQALEQYINILYGEKRLDIALNPDAENERRMDIFLCNNRTVESSFGAFEEENIIVELKAPKVKLTTIVYRQIEDYMKYVIRQPKFNSKVRKWKFIAVCSEVDDDIKSQYKAFEDKGKVGLVYKVDNYEIYAFTWDDIMKSFEMRYNALLKKLRYDREQIASEMMENVSEMNEREKVDALTEMAMSGS